MLSYPRCLCSAGRYCRQILLINPALQDEQSPDKIAIILLACFVGVHDIRDNVLVEAKISLVEICELFCKILLLEPFAKRNTE